MKFWSWDFILSIAFIYIFQSQKSNQMLLSPRKNIIIKRIHSQINGRTLAENSVSPKVVLRTGRRKVMSSLKLDPIQFRRLQPKQIQENQQRRKLFKNQSQKKKEVKTIIKKFNSQHGPKNASMSRCQADHPVYKSFQLKETKHRYNDNEHLTYDQLLIEREKEDDSRRLIILKQVIQENVKRKNQQMKMYSRKRLKTIL